MRYYIQGLISLIANNPKAASDEYKKILKSLEDQGVKLDTDCLVDQEDCEFDPLTGDEYD